MSGVSSIRPFHHGGLRRGSGRPKESTAKGNAKIYQFFWRQNNKRVYLRKEIHATWRRLKQSGSFASDSAFAALEISRRQRYVLKPNLAINHFPSLVIAK